MHFAMEIFSTSIKVWNGSLTEVRGGIAKTADILS